MAQALESDVADACEEQAEAIVAARRGLGDAWQGDAGSAAVATVGGLAGAAEDLGEVARSMGTAISVYAGKLATVQALMDEARGIASGAGLTVTERLIEGPPEARDASWHQPVFWPSSPAEEAAFLSWRAKYEVYLAAEQEAGEAVGDLSDACQQLIEDLGDGQSTLADVGETVLDLVPGAVELPGVSVLPLLSERMRRAAVRAGFLASISPEQSRLLYANLFMQMERLDDARLLDRLAAASDYGGKAVDGFMIGLSAIERHEMGQSTNQILLAEGGGWVAGALATGGTWAAGGAIFGAPATPVGSVVLGGVALVVGTGVGIFTSNQVDDWYEDREFEELLQNGMAGTELPQR
ncbi:hypothetical protein GCM10027062_28790 [Nocardioides hungaricus]